MLVDIDECQCSFEDMLKVMGHGVRGMRAPRIAPPGLSQAPYNVLLAVDVNVGVIAFLMYRGTLNRDTFYCWLALQLLPALADTGPRFLMYDRLSSHISTEIDELLTYHGHKSILRSVHSPDFGFVEWVFAHAHLFSKLHEDFVIAHPDEFGQVFAEGLLSTTAAYVRQFAAVADYFVPGVEYKLYFGV